MEDSFTILLTLVVIFNFINVGLQFYSFHQRYGKRSDADEERRDCDN